MKIMYEFQFDDDDYDMYEVIYAENPIKILVDDLHYRKILLCQYQQHNEVLITAYSFQPVQELFRNCDSVEIHCFYCGIWLHRSVLILAVYTVVSACP